MKRVRISIQIEPKVLVAATCIAKKRGIPRNRLFELAFMNYLYLSKPKKVRSCVKTLIADLNPKSSFSWKTRYVAILKKEFAIKES